MRATPKDDLIEALSCLIYELKEDRKQRQEERMGARILCELNKALDTINSIMKTQVELTADLKKVGDQLRKLVADTSTHQASIGTLKAKVKELEDLIAAGGTITPELETAVKEVAELTQTVDDNVPEVTAPPVA